MKFLFDLFELLPAVAIAEVANKCEREIPPRVGPRAGLLHLFRGMLPGVDDPEKAQALKALIRELEARGWGRYLT